MQLTDSYFDDLCVRIAHQFSSTQSYLTKKDIETILIDRIIPSEVAVKDFYEVDNIRFVIEYINNQRHLDKEISFEELFEIHYLLMNRIDSSRGNFKSESNKLDGSDFQTASPEETPILTKQWMDHINSQLRTGMDNQELIELVAESLITFEHIHPFQRGNSETGQLALIFILLKEKSAPFVIESGDKRRYKRYIHEQNVKGLVSLLNEKISMEENKIANYKD